MLKRNFLINEFSEISFENLEKDLNSVKDSNFVADFCLEFVPRCFHLARNVLFYLKTHRDVIHAEEAGRQERVHHFLLLHHVFHSVPSIGDWGWFCQTDLIMVIQEILQG